MRRQVKHPKTRSESLERTLGSLAARQSERLEFATGSGPQRGHRGGFGGGSRQLNETNAGQTPGVWLAIQIRDRRWLS